MDDSASPLSESLSRRRVLAATGSTLATVLAGCSSGSDNQATDMPESSSTTSPTATDAAGTDTPTQGSETETPTPDVPISEVSGIPFQGFNIGRTRYTPDEHGPTTFNQLWMQRVAKTGGITPPVVADGTIYTVHRKLYALNPSNGKPKWTFAPPDGQKSSRQPAATGTPAVAGDTVVVGGSNGTLYGLSTTDKRIKWRFTPDAAVQNWGAPAIADGTVFVTSGEENQPEFVFAVELETGNKLWARQLKKDAWRVSAPAIGQNNTLIVTTYNTGEGADRTAFALNTATGETRWKKSDVEPGNGTPIVANGLVYARSDNSGTPIALSITDGSEQWTADTVVQGSDAEARFGAVTGERAFILRESGGLVAVSATNGDRQWKRKTRHSAVVAVAGDTLYLGQRAPTESGELYALSRTDGTQLGKAGGFPTDPEGMAIVDGYVFVVGGLAMWTLESG